MSDSNERHEPAGSENENDNESGRSADDRNMDTSPETEEDTASGGPAD